MAEPEDLGDILSALREVEHNLARRSQRIGGAIMLMWGVITVLIAAFYQLVAWDPERYQALLGPLLPWMWAGPVAIGYAASIMVGLRAGSEASREEARAWGRDFLPSAVSGLIAIGLVLAGHPEYIAGALLVGFAAGLALRCLRSAGAFRSVAAVAAALNGIVGLLLLWRPVEWEWLVMGLVFGGSLFVLGRLRMSTA